MVSNDINDTKNLLTSFSLYHTMNYSHFWYEMNQLISKKTTVIAISLLSFIISLLVVTKLVGNPINSTKKASEIQTNKLLKVRKTKDRPKYAGNEILVKLNEPIIYSDRRIFGKKFSFSPNTIKETNEEVSFFKKRLTMMQIKTITPLFTSSKIGKDLSIYKVKIPKNVDLQMALASFKTDPLVQYAEPNYIYYLEFVPNDPYYLDRFPGSVENRDKKWNPSYDYQWNLRMINAEQAWDHAQFLTPILVAVIDTGVDYTHAEFGGCTLEQVNGNNCEKVAPGHNMFNGTSDIMDDHLHGTHVAGTIAAKYNNNLGIPGLATNAKILPIKAFSRSESSSADKLSEAIVLAVDRGARVINASWGQYEAPSKTMTAALEYAHNNNVVVVASAGNDNYNLDFIPHYPSGTKCFAGLASETDCTITVGASSPNDEKVDFSNWGTSIHVMAPGGDHESQFGIDANNILSLKYKDLNEGYAEVVVGEDYLRLAGTSMSAPHVSGLAAMILGKNNNASTNDVRNIIENSADDLGPQGFDDQTGYGRINAGQALSQLNTSLPLRSYIDRPDNNYITSTSKELEVVGDAQGAELISYKLEYKKAEDPNGWMEAGVTYPPNGNRTSVKRALLGKLSFVGAESGNYDVRLTVFAANNRSTTTTKRIAIDKRIKSGWPYTSNFDLADSEHPIIPVVADFDSDNKKEVLIHPNIWGPFHFLDSSGIPKFNFENYSDSELESIGVADVDGLDCTTNCKKELFFGTGTGRLSMYTKAYRLQKEVAFLHEGPSDMWVNFSPLVVEDITGDRKPETIVFRDTSMMSEDRSQGVHEIHIVDSAGKLITGTSALKLPYGELFRPWGMPGIVVGNVDKDTDKEVVVAHGYPNLVQDIGDDWVDTGQFPITIYNPDGSIVNNWSAKNIPNHQYSNVLLGTFDNDNDLELVVDTQATVDDPIKVQIHDIAKGKIGEYQTGTKERISLVLADTNSDGRAEVLVDEHNGKLTVVGGDGSVIATGDDPYTYVKPKRTSCGFYCVLYSEMVVGDIDNDGFKELVKLGKNGNRYGYFFYRIRGKIIEKDVYEPIYISNTPHNFLALDDIDNDGNTDLIVAINDRKHTTAYVFDLATKMGKLDWPQYKHDERRTGAFSGSPQDLQPKEPKICRGISNKVPPAVINNAMANPQTIEGWNELEYPTDPEGPTNLRKHYLSIKDNSKPFHVVTNQVVYVARCDEVPSPPASSGSCRALDHQSGYPNTGPDVAKYDSSAECDEKCNKEYPGRNCRSLYGDAKEKVYCVAKTCSFDGISIWEAGSGNGAVTVVRKNNSCPASEYIRCFQGFECKSIEDGLEIKRIGQINPENSGWPWYISLNCPCKPNTKLSSGDEIHSLLFCQEQFHEWIDLPEISIGDTYKCTYSSKTCNKSN